MATTAQSDSVLELYSAYFNRAADAAGFTFWQKSFDTYLASSAGADDAAKSADALQKIAVDMATSTEYKALYPATLSSEAFINAVYTNLLDRASDAEGLAFWKKHIDDKTLTKEQAINQMIAGAKANTTDQGKSDTALIANKNAVSKYFAETLKSDNVDVAKKAFTGLTKDAATIDTAKASLDKDIAAEGTTQLTKKTDTLTGTDKDDSFASAQDTLQKEDIILDKSTTDNDAFAAEILLYDNAITPSINNIETLNIKSVSGNVGFNLEKVQGTKVLNLDSLKEGTATAEGVATTKVGSVVVSDNIKTLKVIADANGTDGEIKITTAKATTVEFTGNAGADTLTLEGTSAITKLTLDGGDGKDIFKAATADKTLEALTISGGAGKDDFRIDLNGTAEGKPATLAIDGSVEKLVFNTKTGASEFTVKDGSKFEALTTTTNQLVILGDQDITFMGQGAAFDKAEVVNARSTGNTVLKITKADDNYAVNLSKAAFSSVNIAATTGTEQLLLNKDTQVKLSAEIKTTLAASTEGDGPLSIDLANAKIGETIIGADTGASNTLDKATLTNTTASSITKLNIQKVTEATLTGDKDLTITDLTGTNATATHLDASAFTGKLTVTEIKTGSAKITGGTGADKITGGTGDDELIGGAGNDTLKLVKTAGTGSSGADKLTGGADKDTFVINAKSSGEITDFSVTDDTLQISITTMGTPVDGTGTAITTKSDFFLTQVTKATALTAAQGVMVLKGESYADTNAAKTAIETGGTRALTVTNAAGDDMLIAWNDTSGNAHLTSIDITAATANTVLASGGTTATDLITLTGVDATTLTAADFDFIA